MTDPRPLEGLVAAVTGGAGGIGRVICQRLTDEGAKVYSLDVTGPEGVQAVHCDVRLESSVAEAIGGIAGESGRLDLLVHAAGVSRDAVIWKASLDDWDLVQEVNLRGAWLLAKYAIPIIRSGEGGRIVFIGSINGSRGKFGTSAYSASKAGLIGLAKTMARETGRFGICVNVVEPGMVNTPMTAELPDEVLAQAIDETLLGKLVEPDDIAAVVAFLCGPGAGGITGQVIRVDAGQVLGSS